MRRKHIPARTCIVCHQTRAKRELVRIVRSLAGPVRIDETGKQAGRGAYLCRQRECWEKALKGKQLEHALKTTIGPEEWAALQEFAALLAGNSESETEIHTS